MSYETPSLFIGGPSNQTIWQAVTEARHDLGTVGQLGDGREYVYACSRSSAALAAGKLCKTNEASVDFDAMAVNTAVVGDTTLDITPVGTATYAQNELVGGYVIVEDDTGEGSYYRITSNPATTAATAFTVGIEPIRVAFAAGTTVGVAPNLYSDVLLADANLTQLVAGVPNFEVPIGSTNPQYFWLQTKGVCSLLVDETVTAFTVGAPLQPSVAVAGAVEPIIDAAAAHDPQVGTALAIVAADTEYAAVRLNIV